MQEYVYFIKGGDYVKIGKTANVKKRINDIRTCCPGGLGIIAVVKTDRACSLENYVHLFFKEKRVHGEWFHLDEQDIQLVKSFHMKTEVEVRPQLEGVADERMDRVMDWIGDGMVGDRAEDDGSVPAEPLD